MLRSTKASIMIGLPLIILLLRIINEAITNRVAESGDNQCIIDSYVSVLNPLIFFLESDHSLAKIFLAIDSLCIDFIVLWYIADWMLFAKNRTIIPSVLMFYTLRGVASWFGHWPLPEPYLFLKPKLYSVLISYEKTNDLYFSGHCGMTLMIVLESHIHNRTKFQFLSLIVFIYTFVIMRVLGGHFSNDIIIGTLVAYIAFRISLKFQYNITLLIMKLVGLLFWVVDWNKEFNSKQTLELLPLCACDDNNLDRVL